ncbi:MAG TPA: 50S ribosomal protein L11 methyltransferase [bacterium]|nr:50S ribosomal protein L11 methyltransferase [bacterium]
MLDYLVLTIHIPPAFEEDVCAWLFARACLGLECQEDRRKLRLRAYFAPENWNDRLTQELQAHFPGSSIEAGVSIRLPSADQRPPTLHHLTLAGENFRLLAGPAFGSGAHPTTKLCAELLRMQDPRGLRVLDVGTGTGILALLADRLGASVIDAVEISPEARDNAQANFELNGARAIRLYPEISQAEGRYDLVLANLLIPTILHLGEEMLLRLEAAGVWIVSGVAAAEKAKFFERFGDQVQLDEELQEDEWLGMKFSLKRPNGSGS